MTRRAAARLTTATAAALVLAACSSSGGSSPSSSATPSGSESDGMYMPSQTATSTAAPTQQVAPAPVDANNAKATQDAIATATPPSGIAGLLAWNTGDYPGPGKPGSTALSHDHVPGPVVYSVMPPVGGQHSPVWLNAGVYTVPVPSERAVHDMEHGAVWITYDPSLPADKVAVLTSFVAKQSLIAETGQGMPDGQANRYVVMSPWPSAGLPSPIVISSWGYQLRVTDPSDPRLQQFVDTFRHSEQYSPEYGPPVDGVPTGTGGVAASNGAAKPNPDGVAG